MQLCLVFVAVFLSVFASEGLGSIKGHGHLSKKEKNKGFKEKLLAEVKEHLARHKLKDKVIIQETNTKSDASTSKVSHKLRNKIKKPFREHSITRNNNHLHSKQSPVAVPKVSLGKLLTGRTRDSDEVFSEENATSRDKIKGNVVLENFKSDPDSESDSVGPITDSDSDGPITDDPDENENEVDSAPGHAREEGDEDKPDSDTEGKPVHEGEHEITLSQDDDNENDVDDGVFGGENAFTRDEGKVNVFSDNIKSGTDSESDLNPNSNRPITDANHSPGHVGLTENEENPDWDTKGSHVHEEGPEETVTPQDDSDNDDDDEDNNEEDEDRKPGHGRENEQHTLGSLKKLGGQDSNRQISPYEVSNQMSQQLMHIYGGHQDQTAAMTDRERHREALNKLRAYSAEIKQEMLQRVRLAHDNTLAQNAAPVIPQYYVPQPVNVLAIPVVPQRVPLLLESPPPSTHRPASVEPPPTAKFLPRSNNGGYSINVDGLHGVFSKSPGYVVRFHSPNSEVTVSKKNQVFNPITDVLPETEAAR